MDVQRALLSKIINDKSLLVAINARITLEFFTDDRYRRVYEYLIEHWRKYGTAPDADVVKLAFPSYEWPDYGHSIEYFIDGLRQRRKHSILTETLTQAIANLHDTNEPNADDNAIQALREGLLQVLVETAPTFDTDFTQMMTQVLDDLHRRGPVGHLRGIPTGFTGIDIVTGGLQPEQFVVMIGLPKAFKSSTLLKMAMNVHAQGKVPLFVGFEMSNGEQVDRLLSLYTGIALSAVMAGALNQPQRKALIKRFEALAETHAFMLSVDLSSATTVAGLQAKVAEMRPDVLFVDGVYLMQSELPKAEPGSSQALSDIARGLKRLAQAQKIPIIVTSQATYTRSRGGLNMFSAMYTQAFQQSADVLLGVERVDPEANDRGPVVTRLKVLASRSGPRTETLLHWDWSRGRVDEEFRDVLDGHSGPRPTKRRVGDDDE